MKLKLVSDDGGITAGVESVCKLCDRSIDLHEYIVEHQDGIAHYHCAVFGKYDKLVNIGGALVEAIEAGEPIDEDSLREDLLDALTYVGQI